MLHGVLLQIGNVEFDKIAEFLSLPVLVSEDFFAIA